jgi:hypothetical protein
MQPHAALIQALSSSDNLGSVGTALEEFLCSHLLHRLPQSTLTSFHAVVEIQSRLALVARCVPTFVVQFFFIERKGMQDKANRFVLKRDPIVSIKERAADPRWVWLQYALGGDGDGCHARHQAFPPSGPGSYAI